MILYLVTLTVLPITTYLAHDLGPWMAESIAMGLHETEHHGGLIVVVGMVEQGCFTHGGGQDVERWSGSEDRPLENMSHPPVRSHLPVSMSSQ